MKNLIFFAILIVVMNAKADTFHCDTSKTVVNGVTMSELSLTPESPALTIGQDKNKINLIDETYLGLLTNPMAWALRSECQLTQTPKKAENGTVLSIENYFYCLLEDEGSPIGKIEARLNFDYQTKTGSYSGLSAAVEGDSVEKFQINFDHCRE